MNKSNGFYPRVRVAASNSGAVSQAGSVVLTETVRAVGLDRELSTALGPWRKRLAVHDPGKVITDLALTLAVGGDCLADIAVLRAEPGVFGLVASDPTVSRTISGLAGDVDRALAAINKARAVARARAWALAGPDAPDHGTDADGPLVIDLDATLVTAHSDKEGAAPTFKRGYGHHPLWAFLDHGPDGTGEPLAFQLRPATPARTPPPITSASPGPRSRSYQVTGPGPGRVVGSWSAPTLLVARMRSWTGWSGNASRTRSGSPCRPTSRRC